jgi:hypothetical protein
VKGQSNWEIARTPRNAFRGSVDIEQLAGRATDRARGSHILPTPDELRMASCMIGSEGRGAKVPVREGKNPEHRLRSPRSD